MENNLNNIGKRMPYYVPEGFFEHMHDQLLSTAKQSEDKRKFNFRYKWIAAAVIVLIASISFMVSQWTGKNKQEQAIAMINETEYPETMLPDEELDSWVEFTEEDIFINNFSNY